MDGEITVNSVYTEGSAFTVVIRQGISSDKRIGDIEITGEGAGSAEKFEHSFQAPNARILIVDDDPNYMSLVREWLKGTYKFSMANSGMQALKWLGKTKADLILLGHEMPVTSGPQVLEMLRSEEETKDIPVFFLTAKNDRASVMAVVALKPEGYFLKTIQRNELLKELGEYFLLHR